MPEPTTGPSVLVVEDEALLLFTIADDLRDAGFRVFEATNAAAALTLLGNLGGADVLFTDVAMPGQIDGLRLAHLVEERWPGTRIIVTSGHVNLTDADMPKGARFIAKPYTPTAIIAAIRRETGQEPSR